MKRREFITLLGGAARVAARGARAAADDAGDRVSQPRIAWPIRASRSCVQRGLKEIGYVGGQNVAIEYRWAEGQYERLPALAADLVRRQVTVIVATGGSVVGLAAKAATATIPIVFCVGGDPVKMGLVASLSRPGGNVTGVHLFLSLLDPKKLGLLRELYRKPP